MPSPTARLLELLELLQNRPLTTGREICDRLGVNARTVRRYVAALEDLGIPIEGQRGVGGGYRIRPGFRLPPLMLDDDEAVAVSLGLLAARRFRFSDDDSASERALEKVHRVLPDTIRRRLEALETTWRSRPLEQPVHRSGATRRSCSRMRSIAAGDCDSPMSLFPASARSGWSARTGS